MGINLRSFTVPDNSITETKIAPGSITEAKIADSAVTEIKLAAASVVESKIKDNAVTITKAVDALLRQVYIGDETELSVTGTTVTTLKQFSITKKNSPLLDWKKIHVQAMIKTNNVGYLATFYLFVDSEPTARITLTTSELIYDLVAGSADISDLTSGKHDVYIKMKSANAAGIAYNELVDVFTEI